MDNNEEILDANGNPITDSSVPPEGATIEGQNGDQGILENQTVNKLNDFDPTAWQLNVKGETITPKDRDHLKNLAQMGLSYSQSMEQLKQEKARIAEQMNNYQQYAQLDQAFKSDPRLQEHLTNAIQQYRAQQELGTKDIPPYMQELLQRVEGVETYKQQLEQRSADEQLQNELNSLKSTYSSEKWDHNDGEGTLEQKLLRHAYENNIPSLKAAYRDMMFDKVALSTKADALKEAEAKRVAAAKAGRVAGNSGAAPVNQSSLSYVANDSYNDLTEKALQMLGK